MSERNDGESSEVFHYGDLGDMPSFKTLGEGEPTTSYVQGASGLVEQRSGEATTFPLVDGHGDVTTISTAGGEVESRQSFDPWGAQISGPSLEMGYLGAWERPADPTTGLIQMGARSYAPSFGSFATEDPVLGHLGIGTSTTVADRRVVFQPNQFDVLTGKKSWECSRGSVTGVEEVDRDLAVPAGGIRRRLGVQTSGGVETFVVNDLEKKVSELREMLLPS